MLCLLEAVCLGKDNVVLRELVRVAGNARFVAFHDGTKVVKAVFVSSAPVRGFERLVRGKCRARDSC